MCIVVRSSSLYLLCDFSRIDSLPNYLPLKMHLFTLH
jgi:hypothetical protein